MYNTTVVNNEILCSREGELIRISAVEKNAIRFQSFPGCKICDSDYNLMPGTETCEITEDNHCTAMKCGTLTAVLD